MNELNRLYSAMWKSWNGIIEDGGRMLISVAEDRIPITIDGMEMHLGLSELVDGNTSGSKVFFHPACENISSKETEIFKVIRKVTVMKLLFTFMRYPAIIIPIAARKPKKAWRNDVMDILQPLAGVKKTQIAEIAKLFQTMTIENEDEAMDKRFLHIKTTKAGSRSQKTGHKVYYIAKPTFPFYNELAKKLARSTGVSDNQMTEVLDTSISMGALKAIVHLFEACIPGVNTPDDYAYEANDPVAARLMAYLGCYGALAEDLNRIQNIFREDFDSTGPGRIYVDWMENLEQLPDIWRQIPTMDYNSHNTVHETEVSVNRVSGLFDINSGNTQANQQTHGQQQVHQSNTVTTNTSGASNLVTTPHGELDVTPPVMMNGDSYSHYELDFVNMRVRHFAMSPSKQTVVYVCSRHGNFLQKEMLNMMNPMMNMNPAMNMMNPMMGNQGMTQEQMAMLMMNPAMRAQLLNQQHQNQMILQTMGGVPQQSVSVSAGGNGDNWTY